MLSLFLIIRAPPRDMEFPERPAFAATQGSDAELPLMGPHRHVLAEVWAPRDGE